MSAITIAGELLHEESGRSEDLARLLALTVGRLEQYIGMCSCPGVAACPECDRTQTLVNEARDALKADAKERGDVRTEET